MLSIHSAENLFIYSAFNEIKKIVLADQHCLKIKLQSRGSHNLFVFRCLITFNYFFLFLDLLFLESLNIKRRKRFAESFQKKKMKMKMKMIKFQPALTEAIIAYALPVST